MKCYLCFVIIFLSGCQLASKFSSITPDETILDAEKNGFKQVALQTDTFLLSSYQKINKPGLPINIYIEGDGRSWITQNTISPNPTPLNPVALKLAMADSNTNVVYLARPCQYTSHDKDEFCHPGVWTDERFSSKVIAAMNQAVDHIKTSCKAEKISLVGFSGGGGLAVLMAAHRKNKDVTSIRTVAGDLDIVAMTAYHHATPTQNSLNPKDYAHAVMDIPQIHFVGEKDQVVPMHIAEGFLKALNQSTKVNSNGENNHSAKLHLVKNHDHHNKWAESWASLLQEPLKSPCHAR